MFCTGLDAAGITAVLSGGGAATVYAPDAYQSRDLDFIVSFRPSSGPASSGPLVSLGFEEKGGVYHHPGTLFTVEFPSGPLAVGSEQITRWDTLRKEKYRLNILSATDCVKDRLAWFLFNSDFSSMEQALAVAARNQVDMDEVRRWCVSEGEAAKFELFYERWKAVTELPHRMSGPGGDGIRSGHV